MFNKDNKPLQVKANFNDDLRRFSLPADTTFDDLCAIISQLFTLPANYVVKYMDDEKDLISITTDEELEEAGRLAESSNPSILRLFVYAAPQLIFSKMAKDPEAPATTVPITTTSTVPIPQAAPTIVEVQEPVKIEVPVSKFSFTTESPCTSTPAADVFVKSNPIPVPEAPKIEVVLPPAPAVMEAARAPLTCSISRQMALQCADLARQTVANCHQASSEVQAQSLQNSCDQYVQLSEATTALMKKTAFAVAAQCQQISEETVRLAQSVLPQLVNNQQMMQTCGQFAAQTTEQCMKLGDTLTKTCVAISGETAAQLQKISDNIATMCKELGKTPSAYSLPSVDIAQRCSTLAGEVSSQCGGLSKSTTSTCMRESNNIRDLIMGIKVGGL